MEPAGLAVGLVGLATIFTSVLELINKVHIYKTFDADSKALIAQFEADRVRFERWGREIGLLENGQLSDRHSTILDPKRAAAVKNLLDILHRMLDVEDYHTQKKVKIPAGLDGNGQFVFGRSASFDILSTSTAMSKFKWAIRGRSERRDQVELFGVIVQKLHDLVPLDEGRAWAATVTPARSPSDFPGFVEIWEILNKIEIKTKGKISLKGLNCS